MTTCNILLLDDPKVVVPPTVNAKVITEKDLGNDFVYRYSAATGVLVRGLTEEEGALDLVILGNNLGIGVTKADDIAEVMRPHTIVVWNDPPTDADTAPYRRRGFTHFTSRGELEGMILAVRAQA